MKLMAFIAGLLIGVAAIAADTGAELFQKAVTQERAAGNLEEAIKLYQRVAAESASDRALAAKALVAEARCYEKLGQDKAVKLYEQVAHDYKDQRDPAATAAARLVALRQAQYAAGPTAMTQRRIDLSNTSAFAVYQTDGQHKVGWDNAAEQVTMSDVAGSGKRVILKLKDRKVNSLMVSRDFSLILLQLKKPDNSETFAFMRTDGAGYRELAGDWSAPWGCNPEFAWDNRSVLLCQSSQLVQVSVADGSLHRVREADGGEYRLSPDGRFIAYLSGRGIYIVPSQGGEPKLVSEKGYVDDWTRDGRFLIVDTIDSSADALYLLPIKDGQRAGNPVFVRYGAFQPYNSFYEAGRTLSSGAFIYQATPPGGQYAPWLGRLDLASGSVVWEKLTLSGSNMDMYYPAWSPDSTRFAYVARDNAAGQLQGGVLRMHSIASGEDRELYRGDIRNCSWSAQHASLFCAGHDAQNRSQWLSISADTGRAEPVGNPPSPSELLNASASQNTLSNSGIFSVRPGSGGDWKPPLVLTDVAQEAISPDGKWRIYHARDAAGKNGLFRVSASGGQPERLGDFPDGNMRGAIWISPDAQKIVADVLNPLELWMLENFEPRQRAAK